MIGFHAAVVAAQILSFISDHTQRNPDEIFANGARFLRFAKETQHFDSSAAAMGETKEPQVPWQMQGRALPSPPNAHLQPLPEPPSVKG